MPGDRTPYRLYFVPFLRPLVRRGGTARTEDIYRDVEQVVPLNEYDRTYIEGSVPELVWRNQNREAAYKLRKAGLLERSGKHGMWQISDAGKCCLDES